MNEYKVRKVMPKIIALLTIPFIVSGCAKKSDCELPSRHVHLYSMSNPNGTAYTYLDDERLTYDKRDWKGDSLVTYNWNKDYIEITKEDEAFYKAKGDLFEGKENWDYLFNIMKKNSQDYLEFYYHYTTSRVVVVGSGKSRHTTIQTSHHSGWDTDPTHRGVTGEVRLCHKRYYGYNISLQGDQYVKIQSPSKDDIREVINDYPYFDFDCTETVYKEYDYTHNTSILPTLKASDFNYFTGPDLSNPNIDGYQK